MSPSAVRLIRLVAYITIIGLPSGQSEAVELDNSERYIMEITKDVFDALRLVDGDGKEAAEKAITHLEAVSKHLGTLEVTQRDFDSMKTQIGDHKISELITNTQFISENGGVDKVAGWKGKDEEIAALKAAHLKNQEENDRKYSDLQKQKDLAELYTKVTPALDGVNPESFPSLWELESSNFERHGEIITYMGKALGGEGLELLKAKHPYFVKAPTSGGAETPHRGSHTTQTQTSKRKQRYPEG